MIKNWKSIFNTLSLSWGVLFLLFFSSGASALSLGNLNIASSGDVPFEARIPVQITEAEFKSLGDIELLEASSSTYQKLGVQKNERSPAFELSWIKNQFGKPTQIQIKTQKPLIATSGVFHDLVIELKWSSGLIRRAYTVLSDSSKGIKVAPGETLTGLAKKINPEMDGASFDQTLISLYRVNPQAFFAGNIHRLKPGQTLNMPSSAMTNSIPQSEATRVIENADQSLSRGDLGKSSDGAYVPLNEAVVGGNKENTSSLRDRLSVGSSVNDSVEQIEKTKRTEEIVAQEKLLADAKQRIEELEKNIADLKKSLDRSGSSVDKSSQDWLKSAGLISALVLLTLGIIFLMLKRNNDSTGSGFKPNQGAIKVSQPLPHISPVGQDVSKPLEKNSNSSSGSADDDTIDPGVVPDFAKKLFSGIDLNLDTPVQKTLLKVQSLSEQRVKLNLAKSYLKIDDVSTAKLILQELIGQGEQGSTDIVNEARNLISRIRN
jgi:pilus assembly protein FimV